MVEKLEVFDPLTGRKLWETEGSTEETVVTAASDGQRVFIALEPTQIKSVNNRGTFDPNDPSIVREDGPEYGAQRTSPNRDALGRFKSERMMHGDYTRKTMEIAEQIGRAHV